MVFIGLAIALLTALAVSVALGRRRPWKSFLALFVLVFLVVWSGGLWLVPFGPTWGGVYWLPFLVVGLVTAMVLTALIPQPPPRGEKEEAAASAAEVRAFDDLGIFFWVAALLLILSIFIGYR